MSTLVIRDSGELMEESEILKNPKIMYFKCQSKDEYEKSKFERVNFRFKLPETELENTLIISGVN
jgi:hypothetical protein